MIKRFIYLGVNSWRERKNKGTYLRYYLQNPEDQRSILARWLDLLMVILITWLLSFIFLTGITQIQKAIIFSLAILLSVLLIADIIKRKQLRKKLFNTRREMARKSYLEKLEQMNEEEHISFAEDLIDKYGVKLDRDKEASSGQLQSRRGNFEQRPLLVTFFEPDQVTKLDNLKNLINSILDHDYTACILLLRGEASAEIKDSLEKLGNKVHIELIDNKRLAKMAAHLKHPAPTGSLADDFSQLKQHQEKNQIKLIKKQFIGSRKKTKHYSLTAAILLALFILWPDNDTISFVYLFFAIINFALATTSLILEKQMARTQLIKP